MSKFKPLLSAKVDFDKLDYSNLWLSPKYDGIRCTIVDGVAMSRKLLPIPNMHVQDCIGRDELNGLDGELIVGPPYAKDVYNQTYRGVMKQAGEPDFKFYIFDKFDEPGSYHTRYERLQRFSHVPWIVIVPQVPVTSYEVLVEMEDQLLAQGYEGVMLRAYHGERSRYKQGRSTVNEGILMKLKRFSDDEAEIIGVEEEMHNANEAVTDNLGHTKRSTHQENKVGKGTLGALVCRTPAGVVFNIGTGFTQADRQKLWKQRDSLVGQLAKYKHFAIGAVEAPRFPVFLGFRHQSDT